MCCVDASCFHLHHIHNSVRLDPNNFKWKSTLIHLPLDGGGSTGGGGGSTGGSGSVNSALSPRLSGFATIPFTVFAVLFPIVCSILVS